MERDEMVEIVRKIQQRDYVDDDDVDHLLDVLRRETGSPHVSNLIFWPNYAIPGRRVDQELTAEEVVDHALNYRPFACQPQGVDDPHGSRLTTCRADLSAREP